MPTSTEIKEQIDAILAWAIAAGLCDDQNFPFERRGGRPETVEVTFDQAEYAGVSLRNYTYDEIYAQLRDRRAYNARLADGSLLQMSYRFAAASGVLEQHRLALFPVPDLSEFSSNVDLFGEDDIYAELLRRNVVPVPLRFDYDRASANELSHPASHLTIGQYPNCRIPVSAPLAPAVFVEFIVRNFYHTAFTRHEADFPTRAEGFAESILPAEREVLHIVVPGTTR